MKFLVDAQLPFRLVRWLRTQGHDAVHTNELPGGNRIGDAEINAVAIRDGRVVVTKDEDFVDSFLLNREPRKLLLVTTGNIHNAKLERLFQSNLEGIVRELDANDFVEIGREALISHQ